MGLKKKNTGAEQIIILGNSGDKLTSHTFHTKFGMVDESSAARFKGITDPRAQSGSLVGIDEDRRVHLV